MTQEMLDSVATLLMQRVNAPEMDIYRVAREIIDLVAVAERATVAKMLMHRHDELQETLAMGARPMASMITLTLREIAEKIETR